jgi:dTDP-4-amino-4,6-dideoxygalactose transaminase
MNIPFLNFEPIHNEIREEMCQAFTNVYDSHWYIMGNHLKTFEESYAIYNQTRFAVGISNGLDALYIALKTLGVGPGDEVIMPSNTFIATVMAVSFVGAIPVFVEPDPYTYLLDVNPSFPLSSKTKAIIPVHLYGQICQMHKIMELAKNNNLFVIEDNAQAHGATYLGKKAGSFGHINATSFYPGKNLGALGDAGACTTDYVDFVEKIKSYRNYGSRQKYVHELEGHNMRLDELQAAFLSVKLNHLNKWTLQRQDIASLYNKFLEGVGDLVLPRIGQGASHVYHLYVIRTNYRDKLQEFLNKKGIGTLIHYPIPPHLQKAYRHLNYKKRDFPIAENLANTVLSLPIWPGLKEKDIIFISDAIREFFS